MTFYKSNANYQKKSKKSTEPIYVNDIIFQEQLFDTIETLLYDSNSKVRLAAAIAIFTILKKFSRPLIEKYQLTKNKVSQIKYIFLVRLIINF